MLAPDLGPVRWVTSSYSANNGACVELARDPRHVAVRDSKNPDGPALVFPAGSFRRFLP